jgi:predicted metal-binding protein
MDAGRPELVTTDPSVCSQISKLEGRAPAAAQKLLDAVQQRRQSEAVEHELEVSTCHARLLELERQHVDWCAGTCI